jgi:hypothetical protein
MQPFTFPHPGQHFLQTIFPDSISFFLTNDPANDLSSEDYSFPESKMKKAPGFCDNIFTLQVNKEAIYQHISAYSRWFGTVFPRQWGCPV